MMVLSIISLLLLAIAIVFVAFIFIVKCLQYGFDNKYHRQNFLDSSKLPPIPDEENKTNLQ